MGENNLINKELLKFIIDNYKKEANDIYDCLDKILNSVSEINDKVNTQVTIELQNNQFDNANYLVEILKLLSFEKNSIEDILNMFVVNIKDIDETKKEETVEPKDNEKEIIYLEGSDNKRTYKVLELDIDKPYDLDCNFTNKKPNAFEFENKIYEIFHLKDILIVLSGILYKKDPIKFRKLMQDKDLQGNKWKFFDTKEHIEKMNVVNSTKTSVKKYSKIGNTGIYVMTHASGKDLQKKIKVLLSKFKIDESEIKIYFRKEKVYA